MARYQTLEKFLQQPFGSANADRTKLQKYSQMYSENTQKIELYSHTKIEDSYYFHVKIPSESNKDQKVYYDVIIRFFTNDDRIKKSSSLNEYYIQFFSNSPGFIYNYAVLYKQNGFLIEQLYTKMDPQYFNKLPVKTNKKLDLSYDKSIYFACRFLVEHRFRVLSKIGSHLGGKSLSPQQFFQGIKDFQTVKMEQDLISLERKANKELDKSRDLTEHNKAVDKKRELDQHVKHATNSTVKDGRSSIFRKVGGSSTSAIRSITRKVARKSTRSKR